MFYSDKIDETLYFELMEQIKKANADWLQLRRSREYKIGLVVHEVCQEILHLRISALIKSLYRWMRGVKSGKIKSDPKICINIKPCVSNYFSNERIAIYTAVFGTYDHVPEPYCRPDNCDFFIFTDQPFDDTQSVWKKGTVPDGLESLNNSEKNRYLKMHPDKMFEDYKYSIYVDGNVQIIADLTDYVNMLGRVGIGIHMHNLRFCVFDELEAIRRTGRETKEKIERHIVYLQETGMPRNYGLLQCNIIVREHKNPLCMEIMNDWWQEYMLYAKRDQVSLPHVLYCHGISIEEVGILGGNVYLNPAFRILNHVKK